MWLEFDRGGVQYTYTKNLEPLQKLDNWLINSLQWSFLRGLAFHLYN